MNKDSVVSAAIQDAFVYLAIMDTKFLMAARRSIAPQYFSSSVTENVLTLCYAYFDQFQAAPDTHFHDELVRYLQDKDADTKKLYIDYLTRLQTIERPNQAYVISRINSFVKAREFEKAAIEFISLTKEGNYEAAKNVMTKALRAGIQKEDIGLKYFEEEPPYYGSNEEDYIMGTGWTTIDNIMPRGLRRTDFVLVLGGYKGKKSFSCIHFGREALMRGLKVLHITHELSETDTKMRYDRMFGGLVAYGSPVVEIENIDDEGNVKDTIIDGKLIPARQTIKADSVFNDDIVKAVRLKAKRFGGDLIIKKYDMGSATMDDIIQYLDYLEVYENWIPDVILNDYPEKMKMGRGERRDVINDMFIAHKGIADNRKLLVITVSQVTREAAKGKKRLSQSDAAEDIRKIGNADVVFGISQTRHQELENRMQCMILANRTGTQGRGCVFATNLDIGQFRIKDWPVKEKKKEEDEDDAE